MNLWKIDKYLSWVSPLYILQDSYNGLLKHQYYETWTRLSLQLPSFAFKYRKFPRYISKSVANVLSVGW